MKKLLSIICVLFIIFIGMFVYKKNVKQENITASEVEKIEEYISQIYMWQEVTEEALPKFDNINDAPDLWIWEAVKKNLENYELSYDEIQNKAKELFGNKFTKQFPKEGTQYITYEEETGKYLTTGIGLDMLDDSFLIKNIKKTKEGYEVEIIEYLEDYENSLDVKEDNETYDVYIKNLENKTITTVKSTESESKIIETIKENIDSFSTKTLNLSKDSNGNMYIESVK